MSNLAQDIQTLLHKHRFFLASQNKHYKYVDPENRIFVMPKTPSDWRAMKNAIAELRRIIKNPPPSSVLLEEERQARAREADIALSAGRKKQAGMRGAPKTNGTGYIYIDTNDSMNFVPDEIKEASREKTKQDAEWRGLLKRLRLKVKDYEALEADCVYAAVQIVAMVLARKHVAKMRRAGRSKIEVKTFIADIPEGYKCFLKNILTGETRSEVREMIGEMIGATAGSLLTCALEGWPAQYSEEWMSGFLPKSGPHTFSIGRWEIEGEIGRIWICHWTGKISLIQSMVRAAKDIPFRNETIERIVDCFLELAMLAKGAVSDPLRGGSAE